MKTKLLRTFVALLLTTLATATAWAADTVAPTVSDKTITVTGTSVTSISIKWNKATDNLTPQENLRYHIRTLLKSTGEEKSNAQIKGGNSRTITDLRPNTTYEIHITVLDGGDNKTEYDVLTVSTKPDVTPPTPLDGKTVKAYPRTTSISLSWVMCRDDMTPSDDIIYNVMYKKVPNEAFFAPNYTEITYTDYQ